jgi:hypothetical protein
MAACNYEFPLLVNWVPAQRRDAVERELAKIRAANSRKQIATWSPLPLPQRLWERLLEGAGIAPALPWSAVGNAALGALAAQLTAAEFKVVGKSTFKDEFVTCGGVRLAEVDFRTMQSRRCPGLYFAGEILDIDGVTGGFNFQAAWTTGWIAGQAMAEESASEGIKG